MRVIYLQKCDFVPLFEKKHKPCEESCSHKKIMLECDQEAFKRMSLHKKMQYTGIIIGCGAICASLVFVSCACASFANKAPGGLAESTTPNLNDTAKAWAGTPALRPLPKAMDPAQSVAAQNIVPHEAMASASMPDKVELYTLRQDQNREKIIFHWKQDSPPAFFMRGDYAFLVFSQDATFDSTHVNQSSDFHEDFKVLTLPKGSGVVVRLRPQVEASLSQSDQIWSLRFEFPENLAQPPVEPDIATEYVSFITPDAPGRIGFKLGEKSQILTFVDPYLGDSFVIVPTKDRQKTERQFEDFDLIPSQRGLVLLEKSDSLSLEITPENTLLVGSEKGSVSLSDPNDRTRPREKAPPPPVINFDKWQKAIKTFPKLLAEVARGKFQAPDISEKEFIQGHVNLALGYLSQGFYSKSANSLEYILMREPQLDDDPTINTLRAICRVGLHQTDIAESLVREQATQGEEHALLWQGVIQLQRERYHEGLKTIVPHLSLLKQYPPDLSDIVYLLMAYGAYRIKYPGLLFLNMINQATLTRREKELFKLLHVFLSPPDEHGQKILETLARTALNERVRSEATFALVMQKAQKEKRKKTILDLEKIRYDWRGDSLEMNIATELATLYVQEKEHQKALNLYRLIKEQFDDLPGSERIIKKGENYFCDTFLDRTSRPQYMAIALYDRYKGLLPTGGREHDVLDHLAKDYADLDLFPQSERYLKYLIQNTNDAKKKGDFLMRLAVMHERAGEFEKTHGVIDEMRALPQQEALSEPILLLEARLLIKEGRPKEAYDLLEKDQGYRALLLKIDLMWADNNWTVLRQLLTDAITSPGAPVKDQNRFLVSLAIVLNNLEDPKALAGLRASFLTRMNQTDQKEQFDLLTLPPEPPALGMSKQAYQTELDKIKRFQDLLKAQPKSSL